MLIVKIDLNGVVADLFDTFNTDVFLVDLQYAFAGPCPWTSADGECTRRYSQLISNSAPSSNLISSVRGLLVQFDFVGCGLSCAMGNLAEFSKYVPAQVFILCQIS